MFYWNEDRQKLENIEERIYSKQDDLQSFVNKKFQDLYFILSSYTAKLEDIEQKLNQIIENHEIIQKRIERAEAKISPKESHVAKKKPKA